MKAIVTHVRVDQELVVIHGAATGADMIADAIARRQGITVEGYPIPKEDWTRLGKRAGRVRNQRMFDLGKPTRCLAFGRLTKPEGDDDSGTGNMVKICNRGGVIATVIPRAGIMP
jgi:hypothetical protein